MVKKLLKSVSIYGSYHQNKTGVPFFGTPCIVAFMLQHATFAHPTSTLLKISPVPLGVGGCILGYEE